MKTETKNWNPLAKAADQCRQTLQEQQISVEQPGSILRDIETLIARIGTEGLPTQSSQGNLPVAVLAELNARLSHTVKLDLKRFSLRDYPNIAGLYILLRVMELVRVDEKHVWIDQEALALWSAMNPTEKYFALLEAWLIHARSEVLGPSREDQYYSQFMGNLRFLTEQVSSKWHEFDESFHLYIASFHGSISAWNAMLQTQFGLIEVQPLPVKGRRFEGRGWMMGAARRTPWGRAVAWALFEWLNVKEETELIPFDLPDDADFGWLKPAFHPYFPDWRKVCEPNQPTFQPGLYIFKMCLDPRYYGSGGAWRRLAVPDCTSLDDLALTVLDAFKFDTDHLYNFTFRDRRGIERVFNHPFEDAGPWTDEITVGETGLPEKGTMHFLFDYGDSWQFLLRLERIEPPDKKIRRPKVIASAGKPPEQYPNSDWE